MKKQIVSIVRYEKPFESVKKAVELCGGLKDIPAGTKVFIKPNVVFWNKNTVFPPWGVITTSRVVQDMVALLAQHGVSDITIGEGTVLADPRDHETPAHAFETLGYNQLADRYAVKVVNVMERPFKKVDLGDGVELNFNADALASDLIVDLPVLKTHVQTIASLGIKNLKGLLDIKSRQKCHSADLEKDLHFYVARLADKLPPVFTLIDGIYTSELGPGPDGIIHRSNILCASEDLFSADLVGVRLLGLRPDEVPHLVHYAANHGLPLGYSGLETAGEPAEDLARPHATGYEYTEDRSLPVVIANMGMKGFSFPKYDSTICTYCSDLNGVILAEVVRSWKGQPFDEVEVLSGKRMQPSPGKKKTILLGKCMYQANKDHPNINELLAVKSCPPKRAKVVEMLQKAGLEVDGSFILSHDKVLDFYMTKYKDRPEFDITLHRVD